MAFGPGGADQVMGDMHPLAALPWKRVAVFVSSTFSDMHAERDYLVKRVFPDLHGWRERRRKVLSSCMLLCDPADGAC